jgi:hypothetical protein
MVAKPKRRGTQLPCVGFRECTPALRHSFEHLRDGNAALKVRWATGEESTPWQRNSEE